MELYEGVKLRLKDLQFLRFDEGCSDGQHTRKFHHDTTGSLDPDYGSFNTLKRASLDSDTLSR